MLMQANAPGSLENLSGRGDLYQSFACYQGNSDTCFQENTEKLSE